jgi:hypothetical protein
LIRGGASAEHADEPEPILIQRVPKANFEFNATFGPVILGVRRTRVVLFFWSTKYHDH